MDLGPAEAPTFPAHGGMISGKLLKVAWILANDVVGSIKM